jgi:hypothetical protein
MKFSDVARNKPMSTVEVRPLHVVGGVAIAAIFFYSTYKVGQHSGRNTRVPPQALPLQESCPVAPPSTVTSAEVVGAVSDRMGGRGSRSGRGMSGRREVEDPYRYDVESNVVLRDNMMR